MNPETQTRHVSPNFITERIDQDLANGVYPRILTRFPPEPNGYLHIGHAKSICLNFGLALDYGGATNLRMDDTNPEKEDMEYALAIRRDVEWLGFTWERELFASDYYEWLYGCAEELIRDGKAYVDSVSEDEMRRLRGTTTVAGQPSPFRGRGVEENLELFRRMKAGEFPNGAHVLRARIDLAHPNFKLRDPVLYRILHAEHYRTGNQWCVYPMYDFAHPLSDFKEGISHSICTLEFENNRAIYDWLCENLKGKLGLSPTLRPYQHEFARLNLEYTVMSKRKLLRLVSEGHVSGWDDPRMPTLSGFRRRGVTPEAIREFANRVGVARANNRVELAILEAAIRDDLNHRCPRVLAVVRPLRVILTNLPAGEVTWLDAPLWPHDVPRQGSRRLPLTREIYIEQDDFAMEPPAGFKRLSPGACVRLRHSQVIRCDRVVTHEAGQIIHLEATLLPPDSSEAAKGVIHWVSATHSQPATFRFFDRLFVSPDPEAFEGPFTEQLNPASLVELQGFVEPAVVSDPAPTRYQFERLGYFWPDPQLSQPDALVFNRIVTLRDARPREEGSSTTRPRPATPRPEPVAPVEVDPEREARYQALLQQAGDLDRWRPLAQKILAQYPDRVQAYRSGKTGLLGFFVGQAMREATGEANAAALQQVFQELLAGT